MTKDKNPAAEPDEFAGMPDTAPGPSKLPLEVALLLEAQDQAATNLLASQVAVAERLRSNDLDGAAKLLENQEEAARSLLASQSAVAEILRSRTVGGAKKLLEDQEVVAEGLLAAQSSSGGTHQVGRCRGRDGAAGCPRE